MAISLKWTVKWGQVFEAGWKVGGALGEVWILGGGEGFQNVKQKLNENDMENYLNLKRYINST